MKTLNEYLLAIDETYDKMNVSYKNRNKDLYEHWLAQLNQLTDTTMIQHDSTFEELCKLSNGGLRILDNDLTY